PLARRLSCPLRGRPPEFWPSEPSPSKLFRVISVGWSVGIGIRKRRMNRTLGLAWVLLGLVSSAAAEPPAPLVGGLRTPVSVAVGAEGKVYVAVQGDPGKPGDGAILLLAKGQTTPFATGLDAPGGLTAYQEWLFVAGRQQVWRISKAGKV